MKKQNTKENYFLKALVSFLLFVVTILLVKFVDVKAVGPENTEIGLSSINVAIHEIFGVNMGWYTLTELFGVLAILVVAVFAFFGLYQLVKRKSLAKVDNEILLLGGLYAVVFFLYILFEKVVINYRPIIEEGKEHVEASFPSSHTMLICVVMGSVILVIGKYITDDKIKRIIIIACAVIIALTIAGRLVCGVHWFTDILGGCFISMALLNVFEGFYRRINLR